MTCVKEVAPPHTVEFACVDEELERNFDLLLVFSGGSKISDGVGHFSREPSFFGERALFFGERAHFSALFRREGPIFRLFGIFFDSRAQFSGFSAFSRGLRAIFSRAVGALDRRWGGAIAPVPMGVAQGGPKAPVNPPLGSSGGRGSGLHVRGCSVGR